MRHLATAVILLAALYIGVPAPASAGRVRLDRDLPSNGVMLHYRVRGDDAANPYLLILPDGPGGASAPYEPFGANLEDLFNVVYLDPRGGGRSDRAVNGAQPIASGALTIAGMVDDIENVRRQLGAPRWIVLGHGFGAMLGLEYAVAYPAGVLGFIDLNGILSYPDVRRSIESEASAQIEREKSWLRGKDASVADGLVKALADSSPAVWMVSLAAIKPYVSTIGDGNPAALSPRQATFQPNTILALIANDHLDQRDDTHLLATLACPIRIIGGESDGILTDELASKAGKMLKKATDYSPVIASGSGYYSWEETPNDVAFFVRGAAADIVHQSDPLLYTARGLDKVVAPGNTGVPDNQFGKVSRQDVTAIFTVEPDGSVDHIQLESSTGSKEADDAIIRFIRSQTFMPARQGGHPVASRLTHVFHFG